MKIRSIILKSLKVFDFSLQKRLPISSQPSFKDFDIYQNLCPTLAKHEWAFPEAYDRDHLTELLKCSFYIRFSAQNKVSNFYFLFSMFSGFV